ncbi:RluA family pseudouridine synthase [Rickettsiales bacterium]|nr:RluA family pseudouridine synthase [Rickettsiales bacterium]
MPSEQEVTSYKLTVTIQDKKKRLDKFIADNVEELSRGRIQNLIEKGHMTLNGEIYENTKYKIKENDQIIINIPPPDPTHMIPNKDIKLSIIFEDEHMLIIDKQAGLTVHPGAGNHQDTMANALLHHCGDSLSGIGGVERPGIVHRLDKDTSGLIVAAKNDNAHQSLSKQISERTLKRQYMAVCWGVPTPDIGTFVGNIGRHRTDRKKMAVTEEGGKEAITHYEVIEVFGDNIASLVKFKLETGRTHQIRVHAAYNGYPLIGDPAYGVIPKAKINNMPQEIAEICKNFPRQALHSFHIGVEHPVTKDYIEFSSPIPKDISELLECLKCLQRA